VIEGFGDVDLDKRSLTRSPSKWENPLYDTENFHRWCAEGSIANLLFHLGEELIYQKIKLSMGEAHVAKIYHIATGSVYDKNDVMRPNGLDKTNQFRDPMLKCLWIVELSGRYFVQKLNMNKFSTAKDTILNFQYLALPTIMALKSSHNMRFAEDSKIPGNHVTCWWQEQIIDYESKRTYPFSLENLHITCGDTLEFEGLASGYSLVPRPMMMLVSHWPRSLVTKLCEVNSCFHDNWNQNDVYKKKVYTGKRKTTDDGTDNVTKLKEAEPSTEQIYDLRRLQQHFRQLYKDKDDLLRMKDFFERRFRSSKR